MKVIIAGSRDIDDITAIEHAVKASGFEITELVSGAARGVDRLGEKWAKANSIPIRQFFPDWTAGRGAGFIRNAEMAMYGDALIAIWDGASRGTKNMIDNATKRGLKVFVLDLSDTGD